MPLTARDIWTKYFEDCDLPSKIQREYADAFVTQRIQPNMLHDLNKETLRELGVTAVGDQLAILRYIKETNGANAPAFKMIESSSSSRKEPVTTSSLNRRDAGDSRVLKAKATSSSSRVPMVSRSITIQKQQTVLPRITTTGLRSDEILLEREMQSRRRQPQLTNSYRPLRSSFESRRTVASPYITVVRHAQFAARDSGRSSNRRSLPTSRSTIHERVTYGNNQRRSPIYAKRRY